MGHAVYLERHRPVQTVGWESDGELVVVLRPRFLRGPLAWWLQPRLRKPYFRVHLDALGSFVWKRCDGLSTVAEIAAALEGSFGAGQRQLVDRLLQFLGALERGGMIQLRETEPQPERPEGPPVGGADPEPGRSGG